MTQSPDRLARALTAIDTANAADPTVETQGGRPRPAALIYSERMSAWLERLAPDASEPLRIAARAQHIERWTVPRDSYPKGREGYLRWRTELGKYHAQRAGEIMAAAGYDAAVAKRAGALIRKQGLKRDPEAQTLEDVICLVFLENYFADFATKHDDAKIVDILRKTWAKMSPGGHAAALELPMPERARALVERALA